MVSTTNVSLKMSSSTTVADSPFQLSTTTPYTPNLKTSTRFTRPSRQSPHTSPLRQALATCTECTSPETSSSTQSCSRNTRITSRSRSRPMTPSQSSSCSTVGPAAPRKSESCYSWMLQSVLIHTRYLDAINYGVVKVNLDTDMQYAYTEGIRDYMFKNKEYVNTQVGNPDGADKPNKKYCKSTNPTPASAPSIHRLANLARRPSCVGPRGGEDHEQACCRGSQGLQHRWTVVNVCSVGVQ